MTIPSQEQLDTIKEIITKSIDNLIKNDSSIFNVNLSHPPHISEDAKILSRELHETTINHRLAYYIERNIENTKLSNYYVDIEYNRFYENKKLLIVNGKQEQVRPDILLHSRMNSQLKPQHFLVVETKKDKVSDPDKKKIIGFIQDCNYNYLFGLTISYCKSKTKVLATLYYYNGKEIITESLNRKK